MEDVALYVIRGMTRYSGGRTLAFWVQDLQQEGVFPG